MEWLTLATLPELWQRILVCAWEFGCEPQYFVCRYFHSSLLNQPPKFYLDKTYCTETPIDVGSVVHYWIPFPEITHAQYAVGNMINLVEAMLKHCETCEECKKEG